MGKKEKIVLVLLIIAILFSVTSILINFSLLDFEFKPINVRGEIPVGNPNGNVNLIIEGNPGGVGR